MNLFDNPDVLPGIAVHQPHAGLVRLGLKDIETRMFQCHQRGQVVICATRTYRADLAHVLREKIKPARWLPLFDEATVILGRVVAIANLVDCRLLTKADEPRAFFWSDDDAGKRYAWILQDIRRTVPRPVRCMPGWFPVPRALVEVQP